MPAIHNSRESISKRKILRNKSTPQETILWSRLRNNQTGFKFRRQHGVLGYIVDFYCAEKNLAIEIDGSQHFDNDAIAYDMKRTRDIELFGIRVLRFTNAEVNANIEGVLMKILSELQITSPRSSTSRPSPH